MKTKFSGILTLLLAFVVQVTFAQEKTISGTVTDETGMPLPSATVLIQGTTSGTSTDFDGNYSITAKPGDVLQFSFVGYATQSLTVGASNTVNASLAPDNALDEVVVTALGIKREKRQTVYQTETVDSEELLQVQPQNAATALAGKVAGMQVNVQDNGVNPSSKVILRGLRSITSDNSALIVIDGSISTNGAFNQLNPNEIESINTLKGATAAALYGSRAANGVLLVTTKKGKEGEKFKVGLNSNYTFTDIAYMPDFQDEYGTGWQGAYEAIENTNWGPRFDGVLRRIGPVFADGSYQAVPYSAVKNNLEDFYQTGSSVQNTLYLSGSDSKNSYYFSVGKTNTDGVIPTDQYKRTNFRVNASRKMGKLELGVNSSLINDETNLVGSQIGAQDRPIYWFILNTPNNIPLSQYKNWRTDKYASPNGYYNGYYENPYWAVDNNRNNDVSTRLIGNVYGTWEAADWVKLTTRFGINTINQNGKNYRNAGTYNLDLLSNIDRSRPNPSTSFVEDYESKSIQYTTDFLAEGNFTFNEKWTFNPILGATNFTSKFRQSEYRANNLSIPGFYDLSNTTEPLTGGLTGGAFVNEEQLRTYGIFANLNFGYDNFLFLELTGRNDWTSTLSKDNNSYFYPAFGLSFVFSELLNSKDVLNYGKFTFSNSTVYNAIRPYAIAETFSSQVGFPYATSGLNGFVVSGTAVDSDIKKEKLNSTEFGLNLGFLKNRITLDAAYFFSKTTDLITFATTAPSAGSNSYLTNIGSIKGNGLELTLGLVPFKASNEGDFSWDMNFNFSNPKQKVEEVEGGQIQVGGTTSAGVFAVQGEEFPQIKATSYVRDDQGRVVVGSNGNPLEGPLKSLGKATPDYILGFNNRFSYKGFTLSATMDYRTGHVYYSQLADAMEFTGRSQESVSANRQEFIWPNSVINTGTTDNPVYVENTNIQTTGGLQNLWTGVYNNIKENYVVDATSFKLRELALNYQIPSNFVDHIGISKLTLGIIARNILTYLPKENRFSDPEFNNDSAVSGNDIGRGGYTQTPPTSSVGFSVNLEF